MLRLQIPVFATQDEGLQSLIAAALRPVDVVPGHDICRQGEEGDRLWICEDGKIQAVQHQGQPCFPATPCLLGEGVILGDDMPAFRLRPFTYRALGRVKMWELRLSDLYPILRMYPSLKRHLVEYLRDRLLQELGVQPHGSMSGRVPGSISEQFTSSWCESVRCIAPVLKQSPEVEKAALVELQTAQLDDGSLPTLLDGLLDFCTMTPQRVTLMEASSSIGPDGQQQAVTLQPSKSWKHEDDTRATLQQRKQAQQQQPMLQSVLSNSATLGSKLSMRRGLASAGSESGSLFSSQQQQVVRSTTLHGSSSLGAPGVQHLFQTQHQCQKAACPKCGRAVCAACRLALQEPQQRTSPQQGAMQIPSDVTLPLPVSSSQLTAASPFVSATADVFDSATSREAARQRLEQSIDYVSMNSVNAPVVSQVQASHSSPRGSVLLASLHRSAIRNAASTAVDGVSSTLQPGSPRLGSSHSQHQYPHQTRVISHVSSSGSGSRVYRMPSRRGGVASSMSMHPSLAAMSIPTANFGEGYTQWG